MIARLVCAVAATAAVVALTGCSADGGQSGSAGGQATMPAVAVTPSADRGPGLMEGTAERIDGRVEPLSRYAGRVVLVVNTASRCGYTEQFDGLQALHSEFAARGLTVLGFPSNDFRQELDDDRAVAEFCRANFGVTFPMFARVPVTGDAAHPLFARLAVRSAEPGWNFTKYLVDRRGRLAARMEPSVAPDDPRLRSAVEAVLAEPAPPPPA